MSQTKLFEYSITSILIYIKKEREREKPKEGPREKKSCLISIHQYDVE